METFLAWISALGGLIAALFWYRSTRVAIPAPPETAGVGSLPGGYLISKVGEKRIDLHATLEKQSALNSWAAIAACVAAIAQSVSWMIEPYF